MTRVLPQVQWVSARASRARLQTVEVLVWSHDWESARDDLAIPLLESGTGVSQVLAMLYVVLTADTPKTIIIDEPNSFLHPGGVAALLEVFREHPQHQYILSTHSPAVIADANPQRVYIVENEGNEAHVVEVDPGAVDQQRAILGAVGARLGDVFGPERILWVEGKTEEQGFPLIARKEGLSLANTRMLAVVNTGDFNRRLIGTTSTVYRQLTEGVALIPPACGFVFDRETGTEEEQERLKQVCAGKLEFLPRRMYENYLLDPEAIAAVLNQTDSLKTANTNATAVAAWITANEQRFAYKGDTSPTRTDGASLLSALFSDLTEAREQYNKVFHGVQLTSWLLAHRPEALFEIAELLRRMLGQTDAEWPPPSPPEQAP